MVKQQPQILITGGCGFIGSNLADSLARDGCAVVLFDNLARAGARRNAEWLLQRHRSCLSLVEGDIRDFQAVFNAVLHADIIYHLAAQVAVTSSVTDPRADFDINALGTFNVLEAARVSGRKPVVVYTSTNKVYGGLEGVGVRETATRYELEDLAHGIPEGFPVDFHSPYGCSKGAADQYVRDYYRIYGIPTTVFRMSCIYGPRQFGNEDQGWVAHFIITALRDQRGGEGLNADLERTPGITIYGDGKQVRDVLFIDDLVRALRLVPHHIKRAAGQVYNIGGGPQNTVSVWAEFGQLLSELLRGSISVRHADWRPGDQRVYVSDIRKAQDHLGWQPEVAARDGVGRLFAWVRQEVCPRQR